MPFKALSEKDFINREQEIEHLKRLADLKKGAVVNNVLLKGEGGIGKTELLKQLYRILFREEKNTLPFYYPFQRATLKASSFARDYFSHFVRQVLAFLKQDPSIAQNMSTPLVKLMPLASSLGLGWFIDLMDDFHDLVKNTGPHEQIMAAISAPVVVASQSGISVLVMLDNFQLATQLYDARPGDIPGLVSLFANSMRNAMTPHVLSGSPEGVVESIFRDDAFKGMAERLTLRAFQESDAFKLFKSYCSILGIAVADESRQYMKFLGGNPLYIRNMARAHWRMQKREVTGQDFWECYSYEVSEGETAFYWSSAFGKLLSDLDKRRIVLKILMHGMDAHRDEQSLKDLSGSLGMPKFPGRGVQDMGKLSRALGIPESSLRMVLKALQTLGIIRPDRGIRPIENNMLQDFIRSLYMREVDGKDPETVRKLIAERYIEPVALSSFEMTIPMETNAELVAAKALEQIGKNFDIEPEIISQLQLALIEAFINAKEHSGSYEKKVLLTFNTTPEKIEIFIESPGKAFALEPVEEPSVEEKEQPQRKRGMGLKLMREIMDDVRVETVANRTRVVLTKKIA